MKTLATESMRTFHDGTTYQLWSFCGCGCGELVRNRFLPGHDMRVQPHHAKTPGKGAAK